MEANLTNLCIGNLNIDSTNPLLKNSRLEQLRQKYLNQLSPAAKAAVIANVISYSCIPFVVVDYKLFRLPMLLLAKMTHL